MKRISTFILFTVIHHLTGAQALAGRVRVSEDRIILRWVPTDVNSWKKNVAKGIMVRKIVWEKEMLPAPVDFLEGDAVVSTVFPLEKSDSLWSPLVSRDKRALIAHSLLYSQTPKNSSDFNGLEGFCFMLADQDTGIAKAMACYFTDRIENRKMKLAYMIHYSADTILSNALILTCDPSKADTLPAPAGFIARQEGKAITLQWNVAADHPVFSSYELEKSDSGGTFKPLHKYPLVFLRGKDEGSKSLMTFTDTSASTSTYPERSRRATSTKYCYRLRGIDHFGMRSQWSDTVRITMHMPLSSFPVIISDSISGPGKMSIQWKLHPAEDSIACFSIWKRTILEKSWKRIASVSSSKRNFTDTLFKDHAYYKVHAYGAGSDSTVSFSHYVSIPDSVPPSAPGRPEGYIDSLGIVRLKWSANTEADLLGYRVFRRNTVYEEFVEISRKPIEQLFYTDTVRLNSLSHKIQYCIRAMDTRYNNSHLSPWLELSKPDTIPPPVPAVLSFLADHRGVHMRGRFFFSAGLSGVKWIRAEVHQRSTLFSWSPFDSIIQFSDTNLLDGAEFSYFLIAEDSAGNISSSPSFRHKAGNGFSKAPEIKQCFTDRSKRRITLSWENHVPAWKFILYRSRTGEEPQYLATVDGKISGYEDRNLYINNSYTYRIKAIYPDGSMSLLSKPVVINY